MRTMPTSNSTPGCTSTRARRTADRAPDRERAALPCKSTHTRFAPCPRNRQAKIVLRALRRAGASGWRRFNQLIRAVAVFLAVVQGYGIALGLEGVRDLVPQPGFLFRTGVVVSLVAGTMFLIWLGDQISARGVGDGVWLIFAAGYIAGVPAVAVGMLGVAGSLPA